MTIEEKQEYLVLGALLDQPTNFFSREEYNGIAGNVVGQSAGFIKDTLLKRGYMEEGNNYVDKTRPENLPIDSRLRYACFVTDIGKKAYQHLKVKKKWDAAKEIAFWVILAATVITLWFTISDHVSCNKPSDKESSQQYKDTSKLKEIPKQILPPETTKVQKNNQDDFLKNLKNDSLKK